MSNRKQRKPLPFSPNSYGSIREQSSPTRASILLHEDHAQYIQSLQGRKQKLCSCLQLYRLSFENELPQKCLIHNNFITLYCENEFKLLCVNCIYGSAIHKDHRVIPSKNSISVISRNNEDNIRVLEEELDRIKHVDGEMRRNKKLLEEQFKIINKQIDQEFKNIYQMVQSKHNETKKRVNESFQRASSVNDTGLNEMGWWKDAIVKTRSSLPKPSNDEGTEVYKHLVLDLFMYDKIDEEKLTYLPSGEQIRSQFLKEIVQLRQSIEQHVGSSSKPEKSRQRLF